MQKVLGMCLLIIGIGSVASATIAAPEIDPASGMSALTLLGGAVLMLRARRRQ
jgi:hypothetical protein